MHRNAIHAMMENHEAFMLVFHRFMRVLPHLLLLLGMQQEK